MIPTSWRLLLGMMLLTAPALAAEPAPRALGRDDPEVRQAIDRGVAYLKKQLPAMLEVELFALRFQWCGGQVGYALLEAGVPKTDPLIEQLAAKIRKDAARISQPQAISFSILFLDKLGRADDGELIRTFALRLVHGRMEANAQQLQQQYIAPGLNCGWSRDCPVLTSEEQAQLRKRLAEPAARDNPPRPAPLPPNTSIKSTNSSYPLLALWVAQRHDLDVRPVLSQGIERIRRCQYSNGGFHEGCLSVWPGPYRLDESEYEHSSSSLTTCDGLIALAIGCELNKPGAAGSGSGQARLARDPAMARGFNYIAEHWGKSTATGNHEIGYSGAFVDRKGRIYCHTLWSWACTALIYDLKTIGRRDWYAWAAKELVAAQKEDGSFNYAPGKSGLHDHTKSGWVPRDWEEHWEGLTSETSFALLVLSRACVAPELTAALKGRLDLRQVGEPNEAPAAPSMSKPESMLASAQAANSGANAQQAALKETLLGQDVEACRKAAEALAEAGPAGVPALKEALRHHKDQAVRLLAAQTLEKMGSQASGAVLTLEVVSRNDSDAAVRRAAAQAMKAIDKK
jgi:HEAT repeats